MMIRFATTLVIAGVFAGTACKKKEDASGSAKATETGAAGAPAAAAADKPAGGCADGFADPGVGACVKLPAGLKPDPSAGPIGGVKQVSLIGEGHTSVRLLGSEYSSMFWDDKIKELLAGGGFGGKLAEQGKLGDDGAWGLFDADDGKRKVSASHSHGKKFTIECFADHDTDSKDKPSLEEMMAICKTLVAQ